MTDTSTRREHTINLHQLDVKDKHTLICSDTLFAQEDVVFIQHRGERYCLRRTRQGKLILTK